jgi:hypothetical protein
MAFSGSLRWVIRTLVTSGDSGKAADSKPGVMGGAIGAPTNPATDISLRLKAKDSVRRMRER